MDAVTGADLRRTREILAAQQAWWKVIERAALARDFSTFHELRQWLQSLPKLPPTRARQWAWLQSELVLAGCYRGDPIIPRDRQLEIAIAVLEARESELPERAEQVRALHASGLNDREISDRLGITDRQVLRWRSRMGLPARSHGGAVMAETHVRLGLTA